MTYRIDSVHPRFLQLVHIGRIHTCLLQTVHQTRPLLFTSHTSENQCNRRARNHTAPCMHLASTYELVRFLCGLHLLMLFFLVATAQHRVL